MASEAANHTPVSAGHDPNSSSSTLVTNGISSTPTHEPTTPASPFSAAFDPNSTTPQPQAQAIALRDAPLYRIAEGRPSSSVTEVRPGLTQVQPGLVDGHPGLPAGADAASALWAHRLSASFGAIADQIAAASRALATVPDAATPTSSYMSVVPGQAGGGGAPMEVAVLTARLEAIERTQDKLGADLREVQAQLARLQVERHERERDKGRQGDVSVVEVQEEGKDGSSQYKSGTEMAIEELQKTVNGVIDTIKLDQARLYARLHNSTVTTNKMTIKAPVLANGKTPQNFPSTKGEFEHLTKERYEAILTAYNLPIKGDTKAKREALREFLGLTPPS